MAPSAANLVEDVVPTVSLRQFVVRFPIELRACLAYDGKLLAAVTRIAIDSVLGFYERRMRRPSRDGAVAIDLDPLSLLCRLAASVPPPGIYLVHYSEVLGPTSKLRARVVPPSPPKAETDARHSHREHPPTHRSMYRTWAEVLKRTFQIDAEKCPTAAAASSCVHGSPKLTTSSVCCVTSVSLSNPQNVHWHRPALLQISGASAQVW